ncbi:MAG: UbiD family decarboxylase [Chloroflexi bacterium]|nr:UbiD family decarboxylase [Chloroflexota bacterium]
MGFKDLREYVEQLDSMGELTKLSGVSWDLEVGALAEMCPDAILFDDFPGYPHGYRMLIHMVKGQRWLLAVNMLTSNRQNALAKEWKERLQSIHAMPPKVVSDAVVLENVQEKKDVDVFKFPIPKIHPEDGGRYAGTDDTIITRDLDTGRINLGTFRLQAHGHNRLGLHIVHGKDTAQIIEQYHKRGKACPVAAVLGIDPSILIASCIETSSYGGMSEYDYAGCFRGEPVEVVQGELTGLPIPANSEIAIEGEVVPGDMALEGPFGEWTGYSEPRETHVIRVKRLMHRNNPILTVSSPTVATRPPSTYRQPGEPGLRGETMASGVLWQQMEMAGARGIKGVARYTKFLTVISIKNTFAGQARQVGHLATHCRAGGVLGKYIIVVDEDINPYDIDDVMWAVMRRADPQRAIDITRYCWSDRMDSAISYEEKKNPIPIAPVYNSRCVIDACRPVEWDPKLKRNVEYGADLRNKVQAKWGSLLGKHQDSTTARPIPATTE